MSKRKRRDVTKRKRPAPGDRKLPLDDPRWWDWGRAIEHVRKRRLNHAIADQELATAINARDVPIKMDWLDTRVSPPKRAVMLLEDNFFADFRIKPGWGKLLTVGQRAGVSMPHNHVLYAWGPNIEKIWSFDAPTPATSPPPEGGTTRRRPGPKPTEDWPILLAAWLIRIACDEPSRLKNVDRLACDAVEHLDEEIKWAPPTKRIRPVIVRLLRHVR